MTVIEDLREAEERQKEAHEAALRDLARRYNGGERVFDLMVRFGVGESTMRRWLRQLQGRGAIRRRPPGHPKMG